MQDKVYGCKGKSYWMLGADGVGDVKHIDTVSFNLNTLANTSSAAVVWVWVVHYVGLSKCIYISVCWEEWETDLNCSTIRCWEPGEATGEGGHANICSQQAGGWVQQSADAVGLWEGQI